MCSLTAITFHFRRCWIWILIWFRWVTRSNLHSHCRCLGSRTALRLGRNSCSLALGFLLWKNCFVSSTLLKTGSLAASARLSINTIRSARVGKPFLSLILRAFSLHLICSITGNFPDIFPKFDMFISDRVLGDLKVSYNVLEQSANSCSPCPPLFDMFGPSTKASTHAFATICGVQNVTATFFGPYPAHQALLQNPQQYF